MRRRPYVGSGTGHSQIAQAELLKLKKSGQFSDEPVRIVKGAPIHYQCKRPDVLAIAGIKETPHDTVRGTIIVCPLILGSELFLNLSWVMQRSSTKDTGPLF